MNDHGLVWLNVKTIWKRGMRRRFHLWNVKQCKLEPEVRQDPLNLWSLVNSRRPGYISTNLSKPTWWGRGLEKVFLMLIIEMIMMLHWKVFPFLATPLISAHSGSGAHDLIRSNHNRFTSYLEDRKLGCKTIKRIFSQKEPIPKCCQPLNSLASQQLFVNWSWYWLFVMMRRRRRMWLNVCIWIRICICICICICMRRRRRMWLIACIWIFKLEATPLKVLHLWAWDWDSDDNIFGQHNVDNVVDDDDDDHESAAKVETVTDNISPSSPGFTVE